jgi:Ca2+-binding EF-hand superfamily protein
LKDLWKLLQRYDTDQSGNLDAQELTNLITHHGTENGRIPPVPPSEAEVSWILQAAGKHKKNSIDVSEIEFALQLWQSYVKNRAKIEGLFDKYDTDHSQRLEFDQLKLYLTDLNEGFAPKVKK